MMRTSGHQRRDAAARFGVKSARPAAIYTPGRLSARVARRIRARRRARVLARAGLVGAVILTAHAAQARWAAPPVAEASSRVAPAAGPVPPAQPPVEIGATAPSRSAVVPLEARAPAARFHRQQGPDKIAAFVEAVRPHRGSRYARFLSRTIRAAARRNRLSPLVVATTAYVESEFSKESGPCIGVMQVYRPNLRWLDRGDELDPDATRDNIALGARELASYYHARGKTPSLRRMWGRYNGCGPGGAYVDRALRVLHRLRTGDARAWRQHLRSRGPLWAE